MMLGGNDNGTVSPCYLGINSFGYNPNTSTRLQLSRNLPGNCSTTNDMNHMEAQEVSMAEQLQITQNNDLFQDDVLIGIPSLYPSYTGLKLLNDDVEHNSNVPPKSGSANLSNNNLKIELARQQEDFDQFVKNQEELLASRIRDMKQRQVTSFLNVVEKELIKKLQVKEMVLANLKRKNQELVEKLNQLTIDTKSWQYMAKCNKTMVNVLQNNLVQITAQAEQRKEGCGDSEMEEQKRAKSVSGSLQVKQPICKVCRVKEVSILVLPCRHLCLCNDCEGTTNNCPNCQGPKNAYMQVYMS